MSLENSDLRRLTNPTRAETMLHRLSKEEILAMIKEWFESPQLRPTRLEATWQNYVLLKIASKINVIERIVHTDWADGLCAIQIAQIDLQYVINNVSRKKWYVWTMESPGNPSQLQRSLDPQTVKERIYAFLDGVYSLHVYTKVNEADGTHWFRLMLFETSTSTDVPHLSKVVYIVHYPDTEYLMCGGCNAKSVRRMITQTIIHAFKAEIIREKPLSSNNFSLLKTTLLNQKSLGVFSQFRNNMVDNNPLDYYQTKRKATEDYVKTREQRRRIVPVENNRFKQRRRIATDTFGPDIVVGLEKLNIQLSLPLNNAAQENVATTSQPEGSQADEDQDEDQDDDQEGAQDIHMEVSMSGKSVMEGLRRLLLSGVLVPPIPSWLVELASVDVNKVYVNKNGLHREEIIPEESPVENDENTPDVQDTLDSQSISVQDSLDSQAIRSVV